MTFSHSTPAARARKIVIVWLVERITFGRVRGQHYSAPFAPSLRWWWTPWTHRFRHHGWVFLGWEWFRMYGLGTWNPATPTLRKCPDLKSRS